MQKSLILPDRRIFMSTFALGAAAWMTRGVFADELDRVKTPAQTEGPFYPNHLPLDTDNDLIIVNDSITPAVGEITHLSGRILDANFNPVRNALVEIWQVDGKGAYIHTADRNSTHRDTNFQGFGRFLTSSTGEYYFRTIKPIPYGPRTAHVHFKVKRGGKELLTTQCYVKGQPENDRDGVLRDIDDAKARASVIIDFAAVKDSKIGELAAKFDIILGWTPEA